jgi:hypothetical protein
MSTVVTVAIDSYHLFQMLMINHGKSIILFAEVLKCILNANLITRHLLIINYYL